MNICDISVTQKIIETILFEFTLQTTQWQTVW